MSDDRSDRLRERRRRTSEKADPVKRGEPDNADNPVKPDKRDPTDKRDKTVTPVKQREDWGPKQIHLSEELMDQLDLQLDSTNVELRQAGEDPLEKLMHWYPMIVQKGLDTLEEMDAEEIRKEAEQFEGSGIDD
ncbi:hypothetical protein [Natrinema hispanicum]|nr:hypothetical protein [Natrinema hispanicum]